MRKLLINDRRRDFAYASTARGNLHVSLTGVLNTIGLTAPYRRFESLKHRALTKRFTGAALLTIRVRIRSPQLVAFEL
jgi:hypothetical protein